MNKPSGDDGILNILTVTGTWLAKLETKNGKLYSIGNITTKDSKNSNKVTNVADCTDWYLVTTYYYSDGSTYETWEYLGTTCSDCNDPAYMNLCPDDGGGGSSGGTDPEPDTEISGGELNQINIASIYPIDDDNLLEPINTQLQPPLMFTNYISWVWKKVFIDVSSSDLLPDPKSIEYTSSDGRRVIRNVNVIGFNPNNTNNFRWWNSAPKQATTVTQGYAVRVYTYLDVNQSSSDEVYPSKTLLIYAN